MSSEMKDVLRLLPPKPYTDILVERYLETTNYGYYCLYPPTFSHDYAAWWSDRAKGRPPTPEFTCLLIRICACAAQYLDPEVQQKLESELGESAQSLSESYHHAAERLSNTIPPGKGGLAQIQQLFLTSAWFKSESLFVESRHALGSSIHEAQELGMHKSAPRAGLSESDIEMRRRMWCLLYVWDWQMSLLLSRPFIINAIYYPFELPNMQLECVDSEAGPPSPISHISYQCELGKIISRVPGTMGGTIDVTQAYPIKSDIDQWLTSLPPAYRETNPDTQWDEQYVYVPLQRRQLHTIGYMTMLLPFKSFLTKTFDVQSSDADRASRGTAVDIAAHLMEVSHRLFNHVYPLNAKFHLVTFVIFDTAAFLCSAVIHDRDHSLPQQKLVFQTISLACSLMQRLGQITKTGAVCYPVLVRLANSLSTSSRRTASFAGIEDETSIRGNDSFGPSPDLDASAVSDSISPGSLSSFLDSMAPGAIFWPASLDLSVPGMETPPITGLSDFSDLDVGQFDRIWDWQNLDLTLLPNLPA
ncbi:uncharacterized protein N7482_005721 [Penicillium canariense]|uniref:Xylanolytic transcriptional activator regulatory domain-containing protein n=1 Tax=Penicillium canariense TaxID=189055 RepID=A0A9W9I5E9_9EURO|nr:uncharacterized protein N7482_005721 [Penicillium canariense]KAJ5166940.1 hypothetical protein N7482_005721 [Penicillium canariense]